jgi:hypothetical protein
VGPDRRNGLLGPVIVKAGYDNVPYVLGPPRVLGMLGVGILLASIYLYEWIKPRLRKSEREPVL